MVQLGVGYNLISTRSSIFSCVVPSHNDSMDTRSNILEPILRSSRICLLIFTTLISQWTHGCKCSSTTARQPVRIKLCFGFQIPRFSMSQHRECSKSDHLCNLDPHQVIQCLPTIQGQYRVIIELPYPVIPFNVNMMEPITYESALYRHVSSFCPISTLSKG